MRLQSRQAFLTQCATLVVLFPAAALACGACIEDKVAATYDHAIAVQAAAQHELVVFVDLDGITSGEAIAKSTVTVADSLKGVRHGTVRFSASPAALSFVLSPATQSPQAVVAQLQKHLKLPGLKLKVIKLLQDYRFVDPD